MKLLDLFMSAIEAISSFLTVTLPCREALNASRCVVYGDKTRWKHSLIVNKQYEQINKVAERATECAEVKLKLYLNIAFISFGST